MVRNSGTPTRVLDDIQVRLLRSQLSEHALGVKSTAIANMMNALIVAVLFWSSVAPSIVIFSITLLAGLIVWRVHIGRQIQSSVGDIRKLQHLEGDVRLNAALMGVFWGIVVGGLLPIIPVDQHLFLGILGSGMLSAGSISYRTVPTSARLYIFMCGIPCLFGLIGVGTHAAYAAIGLLGCYLMVLNASIKAVFDKFMIRNQREHELAESAETIQLLLNDYEQQGSDWLINLDASGNIVQPNMRFAQAARRPLETLEGKSFFDLINNGEDKDRLVDHFVARRAFRQHILSLVIDGEQRWWSINARPMKGDFCRYRGVVTDITTQRQAEQKVSYMAHYDGLTDLPNRFLFNESLYRAFNRGNTNVGLMYLDLDGFKTINDTLGHAVGDQLLRAVGRRLEACVSDGDLIARLGGDEFAVMVAPENLSMIDDIAAHLVEAMSQPFSLDGHDVIAGVSIGIACAPDDGLNGETLLQNADLALYAAKSEGRGRVVRFETGMDEQAKLRRLIELELRTALANNELCLHYQPIINAANDQVSGYEALIRWQHPERGTVMPDMFIPIAEDSGLIVQVGEWVIRQAIEDLASWKEDLGVSINLSPAQMRSPTLISTVVNALASNGVDAARVCLEITETVLMHDSESNMETLHRLHSLGIKIALDDFGTGYSSLNYLRSFPFDKIKIDRCFVDEIDSREESRAIIRSVVSLAHSLGMTTTAEGVERPEQVEHLRREGCSEVQGFLYSKAIPADELTNLRHPRRGFPSNLITFGELKASVTQVIRDEVTKKGRSLGQ
jgi:diguanylate cyclase (GGDEF)-like protein